MSGEQHVYCLFQGSYSDRSLVGVFTTLEAATAGHDRTHGTDDWEWRSSALDFGDGPEEREWYHVHKDNPNRGVRVGPTCDYDIEERILDPA